MRMQIRRYLTVIARHPISPVFLAISWNSAVTQGGTESRTKSRSCRDASRDRNERIRHKSAKSRRPVMKRFTGGVGSVVLPVRCGGGRGRRRGSPPPLEKNEFSRSRCVCNALTMSSHRDDAMS